jgi:hypothetical protein
MGQERASLDEGTVISVPIQTSSQDDRHS